MGCSSCGGGGTVTTAVGANGRSVQVRGGAPVRYVWRWTAIDGGQTQDFASEDEARAHLKSGNPGSLMVVPG